MKDLSKISKQMREDWDRRIAHDYRFWMSDGYRSDEQMWESGERDLSIITRDIQDTEQKSILELGCGVGRLLRAACKRFKSVTGVDVSKEALAKAKTLLSSFDNVEFVLGAGADLQPIPANSKDVVISFAALTSMPVDVTASYLCEIQRVLKPDGVARIQVYLGNEQELTNSDTLHLRCYKRQNFEKALAEAGFSLEWIDELVLPFQVSFKEIGIEAVIVSLRKQARSKTVISEAVSKLLSPHGERELAIADSEAVAQKGLELEGWMALNYAKELLDSGDFERAKQTVEYVETFCKTTSIDVQDLLQKIVTRINQRETPPPSSTRASIQNASILEQNLAVLKQRFPMVVTALNAASKPRDIEVKASAEGEVIFQAGHCLDHPSKPVASAKGWAAKLLQEKRCADADEIIIYGFGAGYHVEALLQVYSGKVLVIEPSEQVFQAALSLRDCSHILSKITALNIGTEIANEFFGDNAELAVRPQTQATSGEFCGKVRAVFYGKRGITSLQPKIAVLGPLQGGTLPIGAYCTKALADLKQRHRFYDMSGFAPGYHLFDQFIYDKMRQLNSQGQYIEMLSQVLLDSVSEKPIDILLCMAQAPISIRALQEMRKRGVLTVLWFVEDYMRFSYWRELASSFDFVFTIQKGECIERIKAAGAGEVHYLPTACDPMLHSPRVLSAAEKERWGSPISFVGAGYHNRQQSFASLAHLPFKIWGTEWPECRPFDRLVQEQGRRIAPEEYVKIFSATDININLHSSTERDGVDPYGDFVNPRTFELAASAAFQLVDQRSLLPEMFEPGKEIVTFSDTKDLKAKIEYYLAHPQERNRIAQAGRERVLRDHTYAQRIKQMLSIIYSSKYEELRRRQDATPWAKMLKRAEPHKELRQRCEAAFARGDEPGLDGLVGDIVNGKGKLTETEQKLMFLFHVRKQIIRMAQEEGTIKR